MPHHADFSTVYAKPGCPLVIRDTGNHAMNRSVTNDIEWVVRKCYEYKILSDGQRLFYYDSDGLLDEILHEKGMFKAFSFLTETEAKVIEIAIKGEDDDYLKGLRSRSE